MDKIPNSNNSLNENSNKNEFISECMKTLENLKDKKDKLENCILEFEETIDELKTYITIREKLMKNVIGITSNNPFPLTGGDGNDNNGGGIMGIDQLNYIKNENTNVKFDAITNSVRSTNVIYTGGTTDEKEEKDVEMKNENSKLYVEDVEEDGGNEDKKNSSSLLPPPIKPFENFTGGFMCSTEAMSSFYNDGLTKKVESMNLN